MRTVWENPEFYDNRFQGSGDSADLGMARVIVGNLTPIQLDNSDQSPRSIKSDTRVYVTRLLTPASVLATLLQIPIGVDEMLPNNIGSIGARTVFISASEWSNTSELLASVRLPEVNVPGQQLDPLDIRAQLDSLRDMNDRMGGWNAVRQ